MALRRCKEAEDWPNMRAFVAEARKNVELLGRLSGELDGPAVHVDARRQVAVLGRLSDDDLRTLAEASRDGRLGEAAERVGLPEAAVLAGEIVDAEVVG